MRPVDWSPLAGSDPIGGDVSLVQGEARYYSQLAEEISTQVARLRKISSADDQKGKTADQLRKAAGDTADSLNKTHGRVQAVGEALTAWIPHLQTAQTDTLNALHDAQEAAHSQQINANPPAGSPPPKTDAEKATDKTRAGHLADADRAFTAAKKKFDDAVSERDEQASKIAGHIKDALHDGLNDSWWDSVSDWVSQHVELIKLIVDIISWVATALAIVALFIPGVNLIAFAALAFMAMSLAGHTLLASTGNGSWTDVAIDVFCIATMGVGKMAMASGKVAALAMGARGAELDSAAARLGVITGRAATKEGLLAARGGVFTRFLTSGGRAAAGALRGFDATTTALASEADIGARVAAFSKMALPETSAAERFLAQDETAAALSKLAKTSSVYHLGDSAMNSWRAVLQTSAGAGKALFRTGAGTDAANHLLTHSDALPWKPSVPGLDHAKEASGEWLGHTLHLPTHALQSWLPSGGDK